MIGQQAWLPNFLSTRRLSPRHRVAYQHIIQRQIKMRALFFDSPFGCMGHILCNIHFSPKAQLEHWHVFKFFIVCQPQNLRKASPRTIFPYCSVSHWRNHMKLTEYQASIICTNSDFLCVVRGISGTHHDCLFFQKLVRRGTSVFKNIFYLVTWVR